MFRYPTIKNTNLCVKPMKSMGQAWIMCHHRRHESMGLREVTG